MTRTCPDTELLSNADANAGVSEGVGVEPSQARRSWREQLTGGGLLAAMFRGFMTVAAVTLLAKAVSFFKDAAVAHRFGISDALDAFVLAFGVHTFTVSLLGGILPEAFLPVYARLKHERGGSRAQRLGIQTAVAHLLTLSGTALLLWWAGPWIVRFLGHGFSTEKQSLSLETMRALLPFLLCYGMSLHLSMWLRANKQFWVATGAPVLVPLAILATMLMIPAPSVGVLVWGTNIGSVAHLAVLVYFIGKDLPGRRGWWGRCFSVIEPGNRRVLGNAWPFLLAGLVLGGAPIVDQAMAARLEPGSLAVLGYSDKLCGILLALTAGAASEALFPFFADLVARRDWPGVKCKLKQIIGSILFVAVPMVAVLCWQAPLIVSLLFERGSFGADDTLRVAEVLRYAALQIPFYIASVLMSRVVVSLQASKFILATAAFSLTANIVFNAILMKLLGVAGIALSTAIVYLLSCVILCLFLLTKLRRLESGDIRQKEAAA